MERLGVGETIGVKRFSGENLAGALGRLLGSQLVEERCRELAAKVAEVDSLAVACGELERIGKAVGDGMAAS